MPRKDFEDKRASRKARELEKERREKELMARKAQDTPLGRAIAETIQSKKES